MAKYGKQEVYAVAVNEDGRFFKIEYAGDNVLIEHVDTPDMATRITPYKACTTNQLKSVTYYFEDSFRMRDWLRGFRMVWVTQDSTMVVDGL